MLSLHPVDLSMVPGPGQPGRARLAGGRLTSWPDNWLARSQTRRPYQLIWNGVPGQASQNGISDSVVELRLALEVELQLELEVRLELEYHLE